MIVKFFLGTKVGVSNINFFLKLIMLKNLNELNPQSVRSVPISSKQNPLE